MSKLNTKLILAAGIGAIVLLSTTACLSQTQNSNDAAKRADTSTTAPVSSHASWKFANEQEWIVDSIGRDIAEMLVFAKYHNDPSTKISAEALDFHTTTIDLKANKYKFDFTLPHSKTATPYEFVLNNYVWDPANYKPFVSELMQTLQLKPDTTSAAPANFLKVLAGAEMSGMFSENERISKALSATPLDANLHEQAALLQATFDMLELAMGLSDTRPPLNRMCAHLAIAQATDDGSGFSVIGKIADIALESLSCRDGVAAEQCDVLAKTQKDAIVQSWLRAIKIRSTGDYRLFDEKNQTQIEASQFGMRFANSLNPDKTLEYISKHHCTPQGRWMRITMCSGTTVSSGHQVDAKILPVELSDFASDYKLYNKQALGDRNSLISELNKTPTRCLSDRNGTPQLIALSWDDIAAYHARHILAAAYKAYDFYAHKYGVPEIADATIAQNTMLLSGMTLFPLTLIQVDKDDKHKATTDTFFNGMQQLFLTQPELVPAWAWERSKYLAAEMKPPVVLLKSELWFSPPCPMGTAFYFLHRRTIDNYKPDLAELTRLRAICPLDNSIARDWTKKKYGEHPNSDQLREGYGALADFDLSVMRSIANGDYDSPEKYEAQMEKIAKLSPNDYLTLGQYCSRHNQPEKAKLYYLEGIEKAEDSVAASNQSDWVVTYLFNHGEKDKALKIAQNAAEVYSLSGLECLARLYERMGYLKQAEELFVKSNKRYDNAGGLLTFYIRNAEKNKGYSDESERLLKEKYFPDGLKKLEIAKLKTPPKAGNLITSSNDYVKALGMKPGCVIVGINDYAADNGNQLATLRQLKLDPDIKTTFWDGHQYKEVVVDTTMNQSYHGLGVNAKKYVPEAASIQQ
jgi:hypothetical protein